MENPFKKAVEENSEELKNTAETLEETNDEEENVEETETQEDEVETECGDTVATEEDEGGEDGGEM